MGLEEKPDRLGWIRASSGWAWTMWTFSTTTAPTRTRRSRKPWTRWPRAVRQGKALYVGISNYGPEDTRRASRILKSMGVHCLIHQPNYSMFNRAPENGLFQVLEEEGIGCIGFSSLAQGLLTNAISTAFPRIRARTAAARSSPPTA